MSLRVQQLNGDTTFLLNFAPYFAPPKLSKRFPGDYTILIDPWLKGHSSILHPSFQISHHTATPVLHSLSELEWQPDLIVISQDKPDHCHKETLCTLPKYADIDILATPAAARKIRSWQHFDPERVRVLKPYNPLCTDSVVRVPLLSYSSNGIPGEITITNIPTKRDLTGLHNAIGITYQPPSSVLTLPKPQRPVFLSPKGIVSSPNIRRPKRWRATSSAASSTFSPPHIGELGMASSSTPNLRPPPSPVSSIPPVPPLYLNGALHKTQIAKPNPDSTLVSRTSSGTSGSSKPKPSNNEQTLSIIYTPHGVSSRTLETYTSYHLTSLEALPVTALFHSINTEDNPKVLGGTVANGAPGGVDVAKAIGAKHWVGAHDELKDNRGWATMWIKSKQYSTEDVDRMLTSAGVQSCKVYRLDAGHVLRIPELPDQKDTRRSSKDDLKSILEKRSRQLTVDEVLARPKTANATFANGHLARPAIATRRTQNAKYPNHWM